MQRTQFGEMACSIARTADVIGEPWSPLIVRNIYIGMTRFDQLQRSLGISRKVLAERLRWLTENGVLERREYSSKPPRYEYVLTVKGLELFEVLMVMVRWGDKWLAGEAGPPFSTGTTRAVRPVTSNCTAPSAASRCLPPTSMCCPAPARPRPAGRSPESAAPLTPERHRVKWSPR
jgi:DNA-binding HxlR family transcriptional regulator